MDLFHSLDRAPLENRLGVHTTAVEMTLTKVVYHCSHPLGSRTRPNDCIGVDGTGAKLARFLTLPQIVTSVRDKHAAGKRLSRC